MMLMKQLQINNKKITLIETAHVSKASVQEVKDVIETIKPDHICIELDKQRAAKINEPVDYSKMKLIDVIKEKKLILVIVNYILSQYQKKVASQMDSQVGDEMRMGLTLAQQENIPISYIDRDIQITFKRIWSYLSLWEKVKMLGALMESDDVNIDESDIENLKKEDVLNNALKDISEAFPTVHRILVTERDQFMAQSIKEAPGQNIAVIIGAAHGPGIEKHLQADDIDLAQLEVIKPKSTFSKVMKWILPFAFIFLMLSVFGFDLEGFNKVKDWILTLSIASAIGAALCFAHPITILVSFFTAFISAIHPILSVGWFAGISEAYFRAPTVGDFESLNQDAKKIKTALKNNILRTLLVMFMTSLFSVAVTLYFSVDTIRAFIQNLF